LSFSQHCPTGGAIEVVGTLSAGCSGTPSCSVYVVDAKTTFLSCGAATGVIVDGTSLSTTGQLYEMGGPAEIASFATPHPVGGGTVCANSLTLTE
jgi:hypothetical protein